MARSLFARKTYESLKREVEEGEQGGKEGLPRVLGPLGLTSLGVGAIIGTGIFVLTGIAAHDITGPALMLSFVVAGLACVFAALCYAEFAAMVPVAGSAYTYAYATLGELFAWIIGWDLILEYGVSSAAVAHGWSKYFQDLLTNTLHLNFPKIVSTAPFDFIDGKFHATGALFDLPAVLIIVVISAILIKGIKESVGFNTAMVLLKVGVVLFVIVVGMRYVRAENWHPFAPFGLGGLSFFGHTIFGQSSPQGKPLGMLAGAAIIFFAYIGFDSVSTHAEEAKNPSRNVPIAIISSLVICTVLYIAVAAILTGMVPYNKLSVEAPVASAFRAVGLEWAGTLISLGAIAGMTSVLLVGLLSQARIFLALGRDGLLPHSFFGALHPRFRTPWKSTLLTGAVVSVMAGLLPLSILADLVSIGTLLAFVIVCAAVLVMRKTHPEVPRPFRAPLVPLVPILGIGTCLLLMFSLAVENWVRLFVWLAIGFFIYFGYGRRHVCCETDV